MFAISYMLHVFANLQTFQTAEGAKKQLVTPTL